MSASVDTYLKGFYRATRMHSADYATAIYPSVRLSHAGIVHKLLYILKVVSPFQFFHNNRDDNIPTGTPLKGRRMQGGTKKIPIFDQYLALSRK